jgi:hypothetical protein
LAILVGLAACGGGARDSVIVRVGEGTITKAALARWIAAMAPEHVAPDPPRYRACIVHQEAISPQSVKAELGEECQRQYQALRQQALDFLISSQWLIGEAADSGLRVSDHEVQARLEEGNASFPHPAAQADARFGIEAELSAAKIRQALIRGEPKVTRAQIAKYYTQNIRRFERQEQRSFDIVERLHSKAAARVVMRKIMLGTSLSKIAVHEELERANIADTAPGNRAIRRAIFVAKPGVLVGPMLLNNLYAVFAVTRIVPRVVQPLTRVQGSIETRLAEEQQRRTLAKFIKTWRSRWTARTDCHPGYVVQKCRQYTGPKAPEDPLALN